MAASSPKRPRRRDETGQALVELALVLILLLLLIVGVADFARAFYFYIVITNSAREGARYASHFPHYADGIRQATRDEAPVSDEFLEARDIHILILIDPEPPPGALPDDVGVAQPGDNIQVGVECDIPTFIGGLVGRERMTLRTRTEMVVFGLD